MAKPVTLLALAALAIVVLYIIMSQMSMMKGNGMPPGAVNGGNGESASENYARKRQKTSKLAYTPKPAWDGKHLVDTGLGSYGMGGSNGGIGGGFHPLPHKVAAAYKSGATFHYKPHAREMFAGGKGGLHPFMQQPGSTPQTSADWLVANSQARASGLMQISPHTQFSKPVVSSLDPHRMEENPLDPFQDNILYHLSTYRNRNNSFDLRGQPYIDPDFLKGQDQLVNVRNVERLAYHGRSHQIVGCSQAQFPRY